MEMSVMLARRALSADSQEMRRDSCLSRYQAAAKEVIGVTDPNATRPADANQLAQTAPEFTALLVLPMKKAPPVKNDSQPLHTM